MSFMFKDKKVLVTGANGFIGSNLVASLGANGANVVGTIREGSDLYRLDVLNAKCDLVNIDLLDINSIHKNLSNIQPEYIFHTTTIRDEEKWQDIINLNTISLVELVKAISSPKLKKIINFGSSHEYGNVKTPYRESALIQPDNIYGVGKAAGTLLLQQLAIAESLPVVTVRPFYVYGCLEPENRFVTTCIHAISNNEKVSLTSPGFMHDYIYIDDLVEACLSIAMDKRITSGIYNIASGKQTSNEDIVDLIGRLLNITPRVNIGAYPSRKCDKTSWYADISLIRKEIGWNNKTSLEEGINKIIKFYNTSSTH
jgi:nucleoside-diphosphate-sugar epimerase